MNSDNRKNLLNHCNGCLRITRHQHLIERKYEETELLDEQGPAITTKIQYDVLECLGCCAVKLKKTVVCDDLEHHEVIYFPSEMSRQAPSWLYELPTDISELLQEVYSAMHANSYRLTVMGARALVDVFGNKTIGDVGGFTAKLEALEKSGYLTKKQKQVLESAIDAGHAAIHRGHKPTKKDVNDTIDIVENLLHSIVLEKKSTELSKRTPIRKRNKGVGNP